MAAIVGHEHARVWLLRSVGGCTGTETCAVGTSRHTLQSIRSWGEVQDPQEKKQCGGNKFQELFETFPSHFPLDLLVGSWQGRFQMVIM